MELLSCYTESGFEDIMKMPESTNLKDLGMSSLQFIQFIITIEDKYGFELADSDLAMSKFESLNSLLMTLEKYIQGNKLIKKVLICDCDDCLWHGVAGEEKVYIDSSATCLQNKLIELYNRGFLICLCSKNQPENIDTVFQTVRMPLEAMHILSAKVNFRSKVDNIRDIATELNLKLDSFVFLDNSDYEIGLINTMLPEVTTIKVDYTQDIFVTINMLDAVCSNTEGNTNHTKLYREQKLRERDKNRYTSVEEYNNSLHTICVCELASYEQAERIAELSQRTNQFNLSNTRLREYDVRRLLEDESYLVISLVARDKYGDMGLIGAAVVHIDKISVIEAFFLSCRVFDRGFENIILRMVKEHVKGELWGIYNKTEKNQRFVNFYVENGVKCYEE